jgi:putative spermidine/putrescine transport system substrate-binding protein
MRTTRRRLLASAVTLAMPVVRASAAPRSINFGAFGGMFQDLYEPTVIEPFGRSRGGSDVFYVPVSTTVQNLAALRRRRDQPDLDVVLLDLASARAATHEGLLEPLSGGSVLAELAPSAAFPDIAGRVLYTEPLVLLFDAARVRPPATWKVLWNGGDERMLAIPASPDSIGLAFTLVAGRLFGGGNEDRIAADGITAINELARGVISWDPRPDVYHFVGEGNAKLGVGWNMQAQINADATAGRLGVAFPNEGVLSRVVTINLVKDAPQREAARAFIDYALSQDGQRAMVEKMFLGPVNARARYTEAALSRTANTPDRTARAMAVDWVAVSSLRERIIQRWHEVIPDAG